MSKVEMTEELADELFKYGSQLLAETAKHFMAEGKARGVEPSDIILLFSSLLIAKASAVIRIMVPGAETLEIVLDMVRHEWSQVELEKKDNGLN